MNIITPAPALSTAVELAIPRPLRTARDSRPGVAADSYSRGFSIDGTPGWFRVAPLPGQNALELRCRLASPAHLDQLEQRVRRMFDLDSEPETIARHLSADELLAPLLLRNPGLRLPVAFDPPEQAVRAIVGQQVTVKAAVTIVGRLVQRVGIADRHRKHWASTACSLRRRRLPKPI